MAKTKKKKTRENGAPVARATTPQRPAPASNDSKIVTIGAAVIGVIVLVSWLGSNRGGPEPHDTHRPAHHAAAHDDDAPPPPPSAPPHHSPPAPAAAAVDARLLHPDQLMETAPATFAVEMHTSAGDFVIDVTRAWSPNGADRFYNLVRAGFFTDIAFFRVIDGFMAQCGIHGRPEVASAWDHANIQDDPPAGQHNTRGFVSFATAGPNTRTTQFFINFADNSRLDAMGFTPFGRVRDMTAVDALYDGYGEGAPQGRGPSQQRIQTEGNTYLRSSFDGLDYILSARVL